MDSFARKGKFLTVEYLLETIEPPLRKEEYFRGSQSTNREVLSVMTVQ